MHVIAAAPEHYPQFVEFFAELRLDETVPDATSWARLAVDSFFLESQGQLVGYGMARVFADRGHVVHVVAHPQRRGQGVGDALLDEMQRRFRAAGLSSWYLNVKPDNLPALRLYERRGFRPAFRSCSLRLEWSDVARLPRSSDLQPLSSLLDSQLEAHFRLPSGQLKNLRSRGYILAALGRDETPLALAAFDPTFPGAYPFCAGSLEAAGSLLQQLRPHALPQHSHLGVVIEDNAPLADALRSRGATLKLEIVQMRGSLTSD